LLAEKVTSRKRVGLVIEVRKKIAADAVFAEGPSALGPRPVPVEVLTALRRAAHDETPRVALEALYAFGALAVQPAGAASSENAGNAGNAGTSVRRDLLRASGPDLAAMLGVPAQAQHLAALRVISRVYAKRPMDEPADAVLGDAVIGALNDRNADIRSAAMHALGAMHYERSVQALTDLFQYYGRGPMAEAALDALAHIALPASTPVFKAQLASRTAALKSIAVEGLARSGDASRTADIQAAVSGERDDGVLLAASFSSAVLASGSIDPIVEALVRPKLHDQAFNYLVELAPGRATLFARAAQDPDADMRADIADVLGLSGDGAALMIAVPMMQDRDPRVARAAERAVARLRAAAL
jgi:HEAT repeat protein